MRRDRGEANGFCYWFVDHEAGFHVYFRPSTALLSVALPSEVRDRSAAQRFLEDADGARAFYQAAVTRRADVAAHQRAFHDAALEAEQLRQSTSHVASDDPRLRESEQKAQAAEIALSHARDAAEVLAQGNRRRDVAGKAT